ncbi:hypothetical protein FSP39_002928 [Pinctada imbricata]|uniref:Uncharacterized protein n=1 Tax=Pinctada imbricata TaxID=66713 RepID=A0AA88YA36_PINIB|nr:hypothetical protein FSP39_002928 [Pinctada imbricata]
MKLVCALCVVVILMATVHAEGSERDALEKVQAGVEAGTAILEFLGDDSNSKNFKKVGAMAGKVAPFLGAMGPAIAIITMFLPEAPSPELQLMKKEFAKIDAKFDRVFDQFSEVKKLLKESTLKIQYSSYEHTILSLSNKLQLFLDQPYQNAETFKQQFITEYENSYGGATWKLMNGMMKTSTMSDNIPLAAMEYTSNHRRRTQAVMKGVMNLIMQGVKVVLGYHKLKGDDSGYNAQQKYWEGEIKKLVEHIKKMDTQVKNKWHTEMKSNVISKLATMHGRSNGDFATELYNDLTDKFDWRDWHVVAYNELHGGDKHWVKWCSGHKEFRKHGRNVVVASVDQTKSPINKSHALNKLKGVSYAYCYNKKVWWGRRRRVCSYEAKDVYNHNLPGEFKNGCTYASAGVIRKDAGITHKAPSNRLVTYDNRIFKLHVFG